MEIFSDEGNVKGILCGLWNPLKVELNDEKNVKNRKFGSWNPSNTK